MGAARHWDFAGLCRACCEVAALQELSQQGSTAAGSRARPSCDQIVLEEVWKGSGERSDGKKKYGAAEEELKVTD